jgi:hypothetical protein
MGSRYRHLLRRHSLPVSAFLQRSLVLAYAFPPEELQPLLDPHLTLDTFGDSAFLAVAMVQSQNLRPSFLPRQLGLDFFLIGYRIFVRYTTRSGKKLRGLQVIRSETDSRALVGMGNLLSHYGYSLIRPDIQVDELRMRIVVQACGATKLDVTAYLDEPVLPETTVFANAKEARKFEGPMPFTFSYELETDSMLWVEGVRQQWDPKLVRTEVAVPPDFTTFGLRPESARLASAFCLENVPYHWNRGVVERVG